MKLSILDHIVCPTCRSSFKLKIKSKSKNEVKEGTLICRKCNDKFKISKGIPRFVVDQTKDFVRTEMAFSEKWKKFHSSHFEKEWLKDNYKSLIERISGKKVSFVVIYRKEKGRCIFVSVKSV